MASYSTTTNLPIPAAAFAKCNKRARGSGVKYSHGESDIDQVRRSTFSVQWLGIMPAIKVLIINPNSTKGMTDGLRHAPVTQPDDLILTRQTTSIDLKEYGGLVVACYNLHPLTNMLKAETGKLAVGIFEASATTCLYLVDASQKFGIVSTGNN
ncbi:hypothetical protein BS17DRAFT_804927 [Gyrodon lividus]|nr:hypothetical protein BS17DRAFT_804927 [Gyrodon lividus]